jgi:polyisoprenoid-binding protein YceI
MPKALKFVLAAVVVVIVVGGAGIYWFVIRDNAPPPVSLGAGPVDTSGGASAPATPDGTWTVKQQTPVPADSSDYTVFVGYRVMELFAGDTIKKEAVGRTTEVTGTMTIQGQTVPSADLKATLTALKSDQSPRDNFIHNLGLESNKFPTAEFKLTTPIQLPSAPKVGVEQDVMATGDLTLHGQTKSVTIPLQARWNGPTIDVAGQLPINFSDYGMQAISIPTVRTDDKGTLEIKLTFVPQT